MKKIEIDNWKKFKIEQLFNVIRPQSRSQAKYNDGDIPFVASGNYNNGVLKYLSPKENEKLDKGNCISVSPIDGSAFYQKNDFLGRGGAGSSIILLYNDNLNEYNGLFIATIIRQVCKKYIYSDMANKDTIKNEVIYLPADENGNPNFSYMESYMKSLETSVSSSLDKLASEQNNKKIDTSNWKYFNITDCFDLSLPKGDLQVKHLKDGDVSLITPSNSNNGLLQKISKSSKSTLYHYNCLTVDMFGNAYYQDSPFFVTAHGHVNVLIPKIRFNSFIGIFFATIIKITFNQKYGFSDMCTQKVLKNEKIYLPVDNNKNLDLKYMEEYIKRLEQSSLTKLKNIENIEIK